MNDLISAANAQPNPPNKQRLVEGLSRARLLVATRGELDLALDGEGRLIQPAAVMTLTSQGPSGRVLLVFSSEVQLRARIENSGFLELAWEGIVSIVTSQQLAGIVLNPAGAWVSLNRDEIGIG